MVMLFLSVSLYSYGQWEEGVLMDVQEINIEEMVNHKMSGAEAVLTVIEQFIDQNYRYAYILLYMMKTSSHII